MTAMRPLRGSALYFVLGVGLIVCLLPLAWTLSSSFKTPGEIFNYPPSAIPHVWTARGYSSLFHDFPSCAGWSTAWRWRW
jgi:multiple sugar transport system permease protein